PHQMERALRLRRPGPHLDLRLERGAEAVEPLAQHLPLDVVDAGHQRAGDLEGERLLLVRRDALARPQELARLGERIDVAGGGQAVSVGIRPGRRAGIAEGDAYL